MSFLYPLFLVAGLTLAIPVLVHLFNLRRYKTVYFPHTRFLRNIQLNSRRQSQVRYKWLLLFRLLFLASLVLAFAQPFFSGADKKGNPNRLQVIYIDNSGSMSAKKGAFRVLDAAKDAARRQVKQAHAGSRFILLTNDRPFSYQPVPADKVLAEINNIDLSPVLKTSEQVLATVQNLVQSEASSGADLYYYSDFQRNSFVARQDKGLMKDIAFYGIPVQGDAGQNVYIDTAYFDIPVLQTGQSNNLVVHTRLSGKNPEEKPVLQLSVNGQVKSAATLDFGETSERTDTLSFQVNSASWQQVSLVLNDAAIRFDDTFRITARSAPNLSVLVLNEGAPSPYIQAAFRAYNGFRLNQADLSSPEDYGNYNLVILNNVTRIDDALGKKMGEALQKGQSICIFPGKTTNLAALNDGLKQLADIRLTGFDTALQAVSSLQQGSNLVKDLFEKIPENVQLPAVNWHYNIDAGLSANQQAVMSFRNGDPFFARYTPARGQLYICASSADLQAGNFAASYFFVPFLYQMAIQSQGSAIYALTSGRQQAAYLPLSNKGERDMIHLYATGVDAIPPQRPNGSGLDIFIDQAVQQPGFYSLSSNAGDTVAVALNLDRQESRMDLWKLSELQSEWNKGDIHWINPSDTSSTVNKAAWGGFPLWKLCVILALVMLAAETLLLAGGLRKQTAAIQ